MPTKPTIQLGVVEPKQAVANFNERKLLLPSFRWQDVWQEEHQRAFVVAGVMREDVLAIFRDELDLKFKTGGTLADFKKSIRPQLAAKGFWGDVEVTDPTTGETRITTFNDQRLQLIFETNVRQSYAAGKWQRYQQTKKLFPFVMYRTMDDARVRPAHRAWHNLVLPIDDAFWHTHWPPNGWRCRCTAIQLDQLGVDRLQRDGQKLQFKAPADDWVPFVNPFTGEVKAVPRGVDPGFGYNPGMRDANRDAALHDVVMQKVVQSEAFPGAVMAAQAATDMPAMLARKADRFGSWLADLADNEPARNSVFTLGTLPAAAVRALESVDVTMPTAVIGVHGVDAVQAAAWSAPAELVRQLPVLLPRATAVLQLTDAPRTLIVVIESPAAKGAMQRLFVEIDLGQPRVTDGQLVENAINLARGAATKLPPEAAKRGAYNVVWGHFQP